MQIKKEKQKKRLQSKEYDEERLEQTMDHAVRYAQPGQPDPLLHPLEDATGVRRVLLDPLLGIVEAAAGLHLPLIHGLQGLSSQKIHNIILEM